MSVLSSLAVSELAGRNGQTMPHLLSASSSLAVSELARRSALTIAASWKVRLVQSGCELGRCRVFVDRSNQDAKVQMICHGESSWMIMMILMKIDIVFQIDDDEDRNCLFKR